MSKLLNIAIALVVAFVATYFFCAAATFFSGVSLFASVIVFVGSLWYSIDKLENAA